MLTHKLQLLILNTTTIKISKTVLLGLTILFTFFVTVACTSEQTPIKLPLSTTIATQPATVGSVRTTQSPTETQQSSSSLVVTAQSPTVATGSMPKDWQRRWLKGIPCRPPCWEGIIPGQTNDVEAVKLLEQSSLVKPGTSRSVPASFGETYGAIEWKWKVDEPSTLTLIGRGTAIFYDATPNRIVDLIRPGLSGYTLDDVIQSYGEPSHVVAMDETNPEGHPLNFVVRFVYLSEGFMVESRNGSIPVLSKDMAVDNPQFFKPGLAGFSVIKYDFTKPRYLLPFDGYKSFNFYCRAATGVDQRCRRAL